MPCQRWSLVWGGTMFKSGSDGIFNLNSSLLCDQNKPNGFVFTGPSISVSCVSSFIWSGKWTWTRRSLRSVNNGWPDIMRMTSRRSSCWVGIAEMIEVLLSATEFAENSDLEDEPKPVGTSSLHRLYKQTRDPPVENDSEKWRLHENWELPLQMASIWDNTSLRSEAIEAWFGRTNWGF